MSEWSGKFRSAYTNKFARYVRDILKNTSRSVDQVTIQPNGQWELHNKANTSNLNGVASTSDDDDDDLIEITKSGDSVRMGAPRIFGTPINGPLSQYREQSSSSTGPTSPAVRTLVTAATSAKRPISAVIDLTSSGDEDEEPIDRAPKRQFSNNHFLPGGPAYRPAPSANTYRD
jgi:E3 SUMO-protein ligase PIAS1